MAQSKRRRKGEGSILRLDDGTYIAKMSMGKKPDGTRYVKKRRAKTKAEAEKKLREIKNEFERESKRTNLNFNEATVKDYLIDFLAYKKKTYESATSYRRLESSVETHIMPYFDYTVMEDLTDDKIIRRLEEMKEDEKDYSYSSVKKVYDAFNMFFNYLIKIKKDMLPSENPMMSVSMIPKSQFKKTHASARILSNEKTDNERKRFVDEALRRYGNGKYVHRYGPAMVFILNTGLRESEMAGLARRNIDKSNKVIFVCDTAETIKNDDEQYITHIRASETKWESERHIPLNDTAMEMIEIMEKEIFTKENDLLIYGARSKVLPPVELTKSFNRICKAANITRNMKGVGCHCLRHTFASSLFEQGVDIKIISELLGHKSVAVTQDIYVSVINKLKVKAIGLPTI